MNHNQVGVIERKKIFSSLHCNLWLGIGGHVQIMKLYLEFVYDQGTRHYGPHVYLSVWEHRDAESSLTLCRYHRKEDEV